jgi:serine/threonine-protein kinase HipA
VPPVKVKGIFAPQRATPADCDKLAGVFDYPGFELDPAVVLGNAP